MTIYAIGDIHGQLDLLRAAHDRVEADRTRNGTDTARLIHIGDLVDRGPDSRGVIDYMIALHASDPRVITLRGNHDQYFIDYLTQPLSQLRSNGGHQWTDQVIGGRATLASYGVRNWLTKTAHRAARAKIPESHLDFMQSLPLLHSEGECLFVHAGIRPGIPLQDQTTRDLMWIRDEFLLSQADHGVLVVHGHTPSENVDHMGNRLGIDTGAAFGGPLSALAIEGRKAFLLTAQGRVPVR